VIVGNQPILVGVVSGKVIRVHFAFSGSGVMTTSAGASISAAGSPPAIMQIAMRVRRQVKHFEWDE
jgi:hypothetical protein